MVPILAATQHRQSEIIKKYSLLLILLLLFAGAFSQKTKVDSLSKLLATEKKDSSRVRLMWQLAGAINFYNPDTALTLSYQALSLARSIGYIEGESRSLGMLANTFRKIGNYPRALELNIQKLKLEEKRKQPRNLASVLTSIGVVYREIEEYRKALEYYSKADSVIRQYNVEDLKYFIAFTITGHDHTPQQHSAKPVPCPTCAVRRSGRIAAPAHFQARDGAGQLD